MDKDFWLGFCLGCARVQLILYLVVVTPIILSRGPLTPITYLAVAGFLMVMFALICVGAFFRYRKVGKKAGDPAGWGLLSNYQRGLAAALIGMSLR